MTERRRVDRLHAIPLGVALPPIHAHSFASEPVAVLLPPGVDIWRVSSPDVDHVGNYFTTRVPPTRESASRRLDLRGGNTAGLGLHYRTVADTVALAGQVAASTTGETQLEIRDTSTLQEVSRWAMLRDIDVRWRDALKGAAIFGGLGLVIGLIFGEPLLGFIVGVLVGLAIGAFWPTDGEDFVSIFTGVPGLALLLV